MTSKLSKLLKNIISIDDENKIDNLRVNGNIFEKKLSDSISIVVSKDKKNIQIIVNDKSNGKIYLPVIINESGLSDVVTYDYHVGKNSNVEVFSGCLIDNDGNMLSSHEGFHNFYLEPNSSVKYYEKHFGSGIGTNEMNSNININLKDNSSLYMDTIQIKGIVNTKRTVNVIMDDNSKLEILEKIMTDNDEKATTEFNVKLNGKNTKCNIVSRSFAIKNSKQIFKSNIIGNNECYARISCDAIIKDNGKIESNPKVIANYMDARLEHEASIGKINGEQIIKLMSLGKTKEEAEEEIINGFLN